MARTDPDFSLENAAAARGARRVVGVDEVGRGPLAGPVIAAAVWLDPALCPDGLRDSKALSSARRGALVPGIRSGGDVALGAASVAEIDALNILQASHLAMRRALARLRVSPDHVLVDGNRLPAELGFSAEAVIKGDARSLSIAAASIAAKVARDALMADLARRHPGYGWARNAGYPTAEHRRALQDLGVTPHHRRSFRAVRNILYQED